MKSLFMSNNIKCNLYINYITTPLGVILVAASHTHLHVLEFVEANAEFPLSQKIFARDEYQIISGSTSIHEQTASELADYFSGRLKQFTVPLQLEGSAFQQITWLSLRTIPYGTTISYAELAKNINKPSAHRAVANANGANKIAIIIPCHRVINSNGKLGGYRSGLERKSWLLQHELDNV